MTGVPRRILVIDDHPALARALADILERDGHHVTVAGSGADGIAAFRLATEHGAGHQTVLTDFSMAGMDGLRVAAVIKSLAPDTIVVLMTAYDVADSVDLPAGVDCIIRKPPPLAELRTALSARRPERSSSS